MLEKDPSGATGAPDVAPKTEGASPGGASPQATTPAGPNVDSPATCRQFTLQYLIAALKKSSQ